METLHTITTNAVILWNSPIDWSPTGGMIWLTCYMSFCFVGFVFFCLWEVKKERQEQKFAVYQAATKVAKARIARMERHGYIENWGE